MPCHCKTQIQHVFGVKSITSTTGLPAFSQTEPKHVVPAVKEVLANYRATVEKLLADNNNTAF